MGYKNRYSIYHRSKCGIMFTYSDQAHIYTVTNNSTTYIKLIVSAFPPCQTESYFLEDMIKLKDATTGKDSGSEAPYCYDKIPATKGLS